MCTVYIYYVYINTHACTFLRKICYVYILIILYIYILCILIHGNIFKIYTICVCRYIYSISQKWVHPSHLCKYLVISFHVFFIFDVINSRLILAQHYNLFYFIIFYKYYLFWWCQCWIFSTIPVAQKKTRDVPFPCPQPVLTPHVCSWMQMIIVDGQLCSWSWKDISNPAPRKKRRKRSPHVTFM